jgi:hypothetical protein
VRRGGAIGPAAAAATALATAAALAADPPSGAPAITTAAIIQHNCVLKTLSQCKAASACIPQESIRGKKLPVKLTVDFETGIVAGVDSDGWVNATRIVSLARAGNHLMLQGIDDAVAWEMLIDQTGHQMSLAMAAPDGATIGFGDCTLAKAP